MNSWPGKRMRKCDGCGITLAFGRRRNRVDGQMLCDGCTEGKPGQPGRPVGHHGSQPKRFTVQCDHHENRHWVMDQGEHTGPPLPSHAQAVRKAKDLNDDHDDNANAKESQMGAKPAVEPDLEHCASCGSEIGDAGLVMKAGLLRCGDGCPTSKTAAMDYSVAVYPRGANEETVEDVIDHGEEFFTESEARDYAQDQADAGWDAIVYSGGDVIDRMYATGAKTAIYGVDHYYQVIVQHPGEVASTREWGGTNLTTAHQIALGYAERGATHVYITDNDDLIVQDGQSLPMGVAASRRLAHDSGDGKTIYHCPFCGAGQVTARSDGTTECGFCKTCFTVQVQPTHSSMPQTIDGVPVNDPSMPGDPTQTPNAPAPDPAAEPADGFSPAGTGGEDGFAPAGSGGAPAPAKAASRKAAGLWEQITTQPRIEQWRRTDGVVEAFIQMGYGDPMGARYTVTYLDGGMPVQEGRTIFQGTWAPDVETAKREADKVMGRHREASYRTATGAVLDEDAYLRHLAIAHADDKDAVIDQVRTSRGRA